MAGWFQIKADAHRHPKIVALPSDAARWAFIVTLAEGKAVAGRWANEKHYRACVGPVAKHLPDLVKAGLVERDGEAVVIHDWNDYQRNDVTAAERQRRYRDKNRYANGVHTVTQP